MVGAVGSLVAVGRTSDVFECGPDLVVKVPRSHVPSHWAAREARFTAAVRELGGPAPAVRDIVEVNGREAIVFERISGRSMWELIVENPDDVEAYGSQLADVHRRILAAGLPGVVVGLVDRMRGKIEQSAQLDDAERQAALESLADLPRGAALLHGDLHPGNVLMAPSGPVVIDWFDAAIGHPVADVVRSSVLIRPFGGQGGRAHLPGAQDPLLRQLHDSYVAAMADVLNRPTEELRQWEAVVAASRLAENAEVDAAPLLALWRERQTARSTALTEAVSAQHGSE